LYGSGGQAVYGQKQKAIIFLTPPEAPEKAINPSPTNASTSVTLDQATISWEDGGNADTFDVYYGPDADNLSLVSSAQAGTSFTIFEQDYGSPFDYEINRAWRIDSTNQYGTTTGDVWTFTTMTFDQIRTSYRLIDGGSGSGPFDSPPGVQGTDWEWTGENNIITVRRLLAAAKDAIWYESI
jgi:hypothetical protein